MAWLFTVINLSHRRISRGPTETRIEFARRISHTLGRNSKEVETLAKSANAIQYGNQTPDEGAKHEIFESARALNGELDQQTTVVQKVLKWINPVPAVRLWLAKRKLT